MRLIKKLFFIFLLGLTQLSAQNLVPNPSFEDTLQCPFAIGNLSFAIPWVDATNASVDYYNSCTSNIYIDVPSNLWGYQQPKSGNAYIGFAGAFDVVVDGREYVQVQLTSQLVASKNYCVEFYVNLSDISSVAISSIGLYFSDTAITGPPGDPINVIPQIENPPTNFITDKIGWTKISGTYLASGTENFITIGNFKNDMATDSIHLVDSLYGGAYYYMDSVKVSLCESNFIQEEGNILQEHLVFPNPSSGVFVVDKKIKATRINVYNILGENICDISNATSIDIGSKPRGVYYIVVHTKESVFIQRVIKE